MKLLMQLLILIAKVGSGMSGRSCNYYKEDVAGGRWNQADGYSRGAEYPKDIPLSGILDICFA